MMIFYFGDSITLGYRDPSGLGWPGRVSGNLFNSGIDVTAYNLGVRANTTPMLAKRWRTEVGMRQLPDMKLKLVFSMGVADVTNDVAPADSRAAAEEILTDARILGDVLMIGPTPVADPEKTRRIGSLSNDFSDLCGRLDIPFVPVIDAMLASPVYVQALEDSDNVHPSLPGYAALAGYILQSETARGVFGLE